MGAGWEQGCQPSPHPGNLPRRLFCSAVGEREGESCSGGWVPPPQNPPSPLRCPTGCCHRGGVWPDPAARAGCAVPLGTKVQRARWHSPVSWFKPRQPVTPRPCAAWHLQSRAATCPGTHGRRWVRPSVCRGERLAPSEKEPAGSFAAAQQQAEPFAAGRQEPRVLPALCLHPGSLPAALPPLALAGHRLPATTCGVWKNKRGHAVAQLRPREGWVFGILMMGMRMGSLAAPMGASMCWRLAAAGQEVKGSVVLPGSRSCPFTPLNPCPNPPVLGFLAVALAGCRPVSVVMPSQVALEALPLRGVLSPARRRMDVTGSLLGISPIKRESQRGREVAGRWGAAGRVASEHGVPWVAGCP